MQTNKSDVVLEKALEKISKYFHYTIVVQHKRSKKRKELYSFKHKDILLRVEKEVNMWPEWMKKQSELIFPNSYYDEEDDD